MVSSDSAARGAGPGPAPGRAIVRFEHALDGRLGPFRAAVTERTGGVSVDPYRSLNVGRSTADDRERVLANEGRVVTALGAGDRVARLRLEHGARVLRVERPGMHGPADAMLARDESLILWLTVADCYPVVLVAGPWRLLGHCGWRGTAAGLVESMVAELASASAIGPPGQRAWIGPGIGPCCYVVGPEVAALFPSSLGRNAAQLDLGSEIARRLEAAGIPRASIASSGCCTSCLADRFFSHRRDGVTGRMAAVCWSPPSSR